MANVPGLRRPPRGKTFSTCQLVTQARMAGFTLGITTENIPEFSSCSSVIGLDAPGEIYTSGRKMEGVWFENREAAAAHQAGMSRVRAGHTIKGWWCRRCAPRGSIRPTSACSTAIRRR